MQQAVSPEQAGEVLRGALAASEGAPTSGSAPGEAPPVDDAPDVVSDEEKSLRAALEGDGDSEPGAAGADDEESAPSGDAAPAGDDDDTALPPPVDLKEAAERLGLTQNELHGLEVTMPGDGEVVTLRDVRDMAEKYRDGVLEREAWETQRAEEREQLSQARDEARQLLSMLPPEAVTPEMQRAAAAQLEEIKEREMTATLDRVPEWKDQRQFEADRAAMLEHLAPYGFNEQDLGAVLDHRLMVYLRSMAQREQRLKSALERAEKKRKGSTTNAPRRPARADITSKAPSTRPTGIGGKVAAVTEILKG